jgi:hypothetical protein
MNRDPNAITHLSVLTPIRPGNEVSLATYLTTLPRGAQSPFRRLSRTHLARWVIIDQIKLDFPGAPWPPRPLRMQYLLFTSTFNGGAPGHLEEMRVRVGVEADVLWGHCIGYPGSRRRAPFHRYFRHNRLPTTLEFAAYQSTVADIHTALKVRAAHVEFAVLAQRLRHEDLQAAFIQHFGIS